MHMPIQVIRAGRKRKSGRRHPSGELARDRGLDVLAIAQAHPDRQGLAKEDRLDQRAGTPMGRLALRRLITPEQLEASRKYAWDARKFQQVYRAPSPNCPSLNIMGGNGEGAPLKLDEIQFRLSAYNAAFEAVSEAGHKAARAVARVAVYDEWLPAGTTLGDLKRGLSALVDYYGLTVRRKSRIGK